jgi:hypothetical protein
MRLALNYYKFTNGYWCNKLITTYSFAAFMNFITAVILKESKKLLCHWHGEPFSEVVN